MFGKVALRRRHEEVEVIECVSLTVKLWLGSNPDHMTRRHTPFVLLDAKDLVTK